MVLYFIFDALANHFGPLILFIPSLTRISWYADSAQNVVF